MWRIIFPRCYWSLGELAVLCPPVDNSRPPAGFGRAFPLVAQEEASMSRKVKEHLLFFQYGCPVIIDVLENLWYYLTTVLPYRNIYQERHQSITLKSKSIYIWKNTFHPVHCRRFSRCESFTQWLIAVITPLPERHGTGACSIQTQSLLFGPFRLM